MFSGCSSLVEGGFELPKTLLEITVTQANDEQLLNRLVQSCRVNLVALTIGAALGGHTQLMEYFLHSFEEGGYLDIVRSMIRRGGDDYNDIAYTAADYGHKQIVDAMIDLGANNLDEIATGASYKGYGDIVDDVHYRKSNRRMITARTTRRRSLRV